MSRSIGRQLPSVHCIGSLARYARFPFALSFAGAGASTNGKASWEQLRGGEPLQRAYRFLRKHRLKDKRAAMQRLPDVTNG
jgi:hypothetical protein